MDYDNPQFGEMPEHIICSKCGASIEDWGEPSTFCYQCGFDL